MGDSDASVEVRVHEDDDPRIERILDLIDEAARPRPLEEVLGVLCAEVAAVVEAQVASIYVRDDDADDTLVMRANVGFPGGAIGKVRLHVGEGITGFAAECMRPVTVSTAAEDEHFKPVPGLGEEEFPIFLALPILVGRRAEAVLVLQRRTGRAFALDEVVLATALATCFAYALERARAREELGEEEGPKHARLVGRSRSPGAALGRVETPPTFEGLAAVARARGLADEVEPEGRAERLEEALHHAARDFARGLKLVEDELPPEVAGHLSGLFLLWEDQRLLQVIRERSEEQPNPAFVFRDVAKVYARAPYEAASAADASTRARTREVETLCLAAALRALDLRSPKQGAVVALADHCPALFALLAAANRVAAIAVSGALDEDAPAPVIARAAGLPMVDRVGGLFAWARVGDRVLVDADAGIVRVNPSATAVARFRRTP